MFSVPFNQDKNIINVYQKYKDVIEEVYFPASPIIFKSCRVIKWDETNEQLVVDLIKELNKLNIIPNMLMNSINDDNIFNSESRTRIVEYLTYMNSIGLKAVTVANPILFRLIRENIPDLLVGLSIVSNIHSISQIQTFYENGLYEICIPPILSRNKQFMLDIKKLMPDLKIKLMANCFCSPNCIAFMHHHIAVGAHDKHKDDQYFDYICNQAYMNPLKKNFILPGEIKYYDYVDIFKISGREFPTEMIEFILDKYKNEKNTEYDLLKLLDGFKLKKSKLINTSYHKIVRDVEKIQNCNFNCQINNCNYCDEILEKYFDYEMGEI